MPDFSRPLNPDPWRCEHCGTVYVVSSLADLCRLRCEADGHAR